MTLSLVTSSVKQGHSIFKNGSNHDEIQYDCIYCEGGECSKSQTEEEKKKVNLREISLVEVRVERERGQTSFCIPNGGEIKCLKGDAK